MLLQDNDFSNDYEFEKISSQGKRQKLFIKRKIIHLFKKKYRKLDDNQVVPVIHGYHKNKDNYRLLQLMVFNKSITLYLEPTDGYLAGEKTPVFMAKVNPNKNNSVQFMRIHNV